MRQHRGGESADRERDSSPAESPKSETDGRGVIEAIHIGLRRKEPMIAVESIHAVPGRGIEGDRMFRMTAGDENPHPSREITLIEAESLEAMREETGIALAPIESRRNLLTRGVALNPLVGRRFRVGSVTLEGIMPCDPCGHLELLTRTGVKSGLENRGGLRARIVTEGVIRAGDPIEIEEA